MPEPDQPQTDPPAQALSGELDNPYDNIVGGVDHGGRELPARQKPPLPFAAAEGR